MAVQHRFDLGAVHHGFPANMQAYLFELHHSHGSPSTVSSHLLSLNALNPLVLVQYSLFRQQTRAFFSSPFDYPLMLSYIPLPLLQRYRASRTRCFA